MSREPRAEGAGVDWSSGQFVDWSIGRKDDKETRRQGDKERGDPWSRRCLGLFFGELLEEEFAEDGFHLLRHVSRGRLPVVDPGTPRERGVISAVHALP